MPVLPNPRHEAFAQALAKGMSQDAAYAEAGFKPHRQNASRLMSNDDVRRRVDEIQSKAVKKLEVTVESLARELEEARALALEHQQTSAAVSATMGKAKLFGLGVENRRLSGQVHIVNITPKQIEALTKHELDLLEQAYPILQKLGIVGGDMAGEGEPEE